MAKGHQLNLHLQHIQDMFQQLGMAVLLQMLQTMGQVYILITVIRYDAIQPYFPAATFSLIPSEITLLLPACP